jgi:ring-1,2-phenylacetyl-CoA epoxidase subunit PaaE
MSRFHALKVKDIRRETEESVSISFHIPEDLKESYQFIPGQYLTLKAMIGGEELRRSYSICSGIDENELRVAIKQVPEGVFSTWANNSLKTEDTLDVMIPMGQFHLDPFTDEPKRYVGIAAGSGITPLLSMIKSIMSQEGESHFTLIYGNKNFDSIIFREELEDLKNQFPERLAVHHVLSRESLEIPLYCGRIDSHKCDIFFDKLIPIAQVDDFYLCGPGEMIETVKNSLKSKGIASDKIKTEFFTAPGASTVQRVISTKENGVGTSSDVTVILDGNTYQFQMFPGTSNVLDAALRAGADLPYSCKGGVCCTCRAKVKEGQVKMDLNYSLEDDEVEAGFVLTCQSHPLTPTLVVDFDA